MNTRCVARERAYIVDYVRIAIIKQAKNGIPTHTSLILSTLLLQTAQKAPGITLILPISATLCVFLCALCG